MRQAAVARAVHERKDVRARFVPVLGAQAREKIEKGALAELGRVIDIARIVPFLQEAFANAVGSNTSVLGARYERKDAPLEDPP